MGKYFFCLDVPTFIHNWLHFMLEKKTRSSSRMSVYRAATTASSVSAWMQCNTTLVSASSWLALSISMSSNGSVHWFSCAKSTSNYNNLVTRCLGNQFVGKYKCKVLFIGRNSQQIIPVLRQWYCSVVDYLPDRTSFPLSVFVGTAPLLVELSM